MTSVSFTGQVVAITGAGGGLGRAFALEVARRGGSVVVNDLGGSVTGAGDETSIAFADRVVEEIRAAGGRAVASYDSVATPQGGQAIIQAALDSFGQIDAVIANAGNMRLGEFEDLSFDDLQALLAVHVGGSWNVAKAAWPHMKARGYGRMVFMTSSGGMLGTGKLTAYGAAKGGVMGLMHGLSEAGALHGILCNAIMPNAASRMTMDIAPGELGENPWSAQMPQYFAPQFTAGLAAFLASSACQTWHGVYSALGGRVARMFIAAANGYLGDDTIDADVIAAHWDEIRDDTRGYAIPANITDEFRIVAEMKGIEV
ncbi:MAG: SDR family NAD(P)-dependent oxidoreductase [Sphingomonadales bacterium]|nr:SDR family NAD(P)-dependent oxidoreductase [Sphingomonadales bacterium]